MAYNGQYDNSGRPYGGGLGPQRPPPQRHYPPGPGDLPPPQQYNAPPPQHQHQHQQYDQYQDGYDYGYDEYGNGGYDQGYGGQQQQQQQQQYTDMNYGRGGPPNQGYPQQDYYDQGPGPNGPGRGGRPMPGGRGGPMRPPPGDGGRGAYPPRGGGYGPGPGGPGGLGRGYPPQGRGGRPGPPDRGANSDPSANRRPTMNGPGGGGAFPAFPGVQPKSDLDQEQEIIAKMEGVNLSGGPRPGPRGPGPNSPPSQRGPMRPANGYGSPGSMGPPRGPPQPYHQQQDYPDQRRGPPPSPGYGPQMGGYQDEGYGPPGRSMTMPTREHVDMRPIGGPPIRRDSAPYNGPVGHRVPPRPNTAQGMQPQRNYPPNDVPPLPQNNFREPEYGNPPDSGYGATQDRRTSMDDLYDYYGNDDHNDYQAQNPQPAQSELPNFDSLRSQAPRNSFDQHVAQAQPEQAQRGPGRQPEINRAKSQPDLRNSQTAVFEMAGDIPPLPTQRQVMEQQAFQQQQQQQRGSFDNPQSQNFRSPAPLQAGGGPAGLPPGPMPYRPGQQQPLPPQSVSSSEVLPQHPAPIRPGLMAGSVVNLSDRPPPVRNYSGNTAYSAPTPAPGGQQLSAPPQQQQPSPGGNPPAPKPVETPVTIEELEHLRAIIKHDASDQGSALRLAKRLVEAADVLIPNLPDPKARARARERYLVDANKILRKLEKATNPDAMFFLADCLGRGLFGAPEHSHAFSLYQSAAKLGHAAAAYRTAVCCEIGNDDGGGTRKDPLKAMQWYKRAATLGDPPAMYKVGMILLKGLLGQPRNPREAISWLKRAAERADTENPHALHELALLYESAEPNDVIIRDEGYAFTLFQQAAELGYKFSQFRLGCAYEYGLLGCPVDARLSILWYSRAAMQEEHQSELALSGWYLTGSEGVLQQSDTEAYLWARKAAMAGLAKAEYAMGYFTEVGIGVPANLEDAKRWYWRAAAQDFPKARERLEDLKRAGKNGAPRSRERISRSKVGKQNEGECSLM
ncbi:chitin synthase [Podospora fimiseda]|uniref:Chitin synthase n=1 Tax=Podospora fimiseda TaxID=252190 RepID=A0AAN7H5W1_9PEZI|nr:chitin synthase [Podospora fimiseda]